MLIGNDFTDSYVAGKNTGVGSLRMGNTASATGINATAAGESSVASAENASALGSGAKATKKNATAVGHGSTASAKNTTAIGQGAKATKKNATAVGQGAKATAKNSVALGQGSIADQENTVSVGTVGNERQIVNVASGGSVNTNAANIGDVKRLVGESEARINQRIDGVERNINSFNKDANAGIASAMAVANLGQAYRPGQSSLSMGVAHYNGGTGVALGGSRLSENGKFMLKGAITTNNRSKHGVAASATFFFP